MIDDDGLKARVDELIENLDFYLRNYDRLISSGYRKSVLDREINSLEDEIKELSEHV
jgi:hypothetical protein